MQEKRCFLASTFSGYRAVMLRRLAASYWVQAASAVGAVLLHAVWWSADPKHHGEIVSGFGAALIVLGVWIAAGPYIRDGFAVLVEKAMPRRHGRTFLLPSRTPEQRAADEAAREVQRRRVALDVAAERFVAAVVVAVGTILNGYGSPLVRLFGLEG